MNRCHKSGHRDLQHWASWFILAFSLVRTADSTTVTSATRSLAVGDFDSINQVLSGTIFSLPSMSKSEGTTTLSLTDITCRNVNVGDILLDHLSDSTTTSSDAFSVQVQLVDLVLNCEADYRYSGFLMSGNGVVTVTSTNNDVTVTGSVLSEPDASDSDPPTSIVLDGCNPSVHIDNIGFDDGGFTGWVLNLVEGLARGIMENLVEDLLCQELEQALANAQELLLDFNSKLEEYPVDLVVDPLQSEQSLLSLSSSSSSSPTEDDSESVWLDLSNPQSTLGQWTHEALNRGIDSLQQMVTVEGYTDPQLQANVWIRDWLNEDRGLLALDPNMDAPWTILYQHDLLMETSIQVSRVQVLGLDTLTELNPLDILGKHTLQSQVAWEYLSIELDAIMDIKPSSLEGAVVSGTDGWIEEFTIVLGLAEVQATVALLAAIQQELLESLRLGSLLTKANLFPCLLSTISQLEFSAFTIDAGDIFTPYLSPLESVGLYRILNQVVEFVFDLYETVVLERAPAIFQKDFRGLLNEQLNTILQTMTGDSGCPAPSLPTETSAPESFIDFRDLLLNPFEAWFRGATGNQPYGDLIPSLITPDLDTQLMSAELFNSRLIGSATKAQSGQAGTFHWSDASLMNYTNSAPTALFDSAVLQVSNLRINHLDTVQEPLNILDARDWNSLYQTITFASDDRPLQLITSILVAFGHESSPLAMSNQWDVSIEIPSVSMELGILANMKESRLLQFPLVDVPNPYCWLSTLEAHVEELEDGKSVTLLPLMMETLGLVVTTFQLNAECVTCISPGATVLSELLRDDLPAAGFQDVFTSRIVSLAEDMVRYYWNSVDIDVLMKQAKSQCSHQTAGSVTGSPLPLDFDSLRISSERFSLQSMSTDSLDTLLGLAIVTLEVAMAVGARNHLLLGEQVPNEGNIVLMESSELPGDVLNWMNLSTAMGDWADFAFDELRKYMMAPVSAVEGVSPNTTDVNLVHLLKEHILDENGALVIQLQLDDATFDSFGFELSKIRVEVLGLDTLSGLDIMIPTQPQVLRNSFDLGALAIALEATVTIGARTEDVKLVYSIKNLSIAFDLLLSVDLSAIQAIAIGSIFKIEDIVSCFASGIKDLQIHNISSSLGDLQGPLLSGFFESSFRGSIESVLASLTEKYHNDTVTAFPFFLETSFKDIVNSLMPAALASMRSACPSPPPYPSDSAVDFRELLLPAKDSMALGSAGQEPYGDLFQVLYDLLVENVLRTGASNRPMINDIFRHLTSTQSNISGTLIVEDDVFNSKSKIKIAGLDATIGFQVSHLSVKNLDSVGDPLELANPMADQPNVLSNTLSFGVDSKPVQIAASFVLSVSDGADMNIRNELRLGLTLQDVRIMTDILLMISEKSFAGFPIGDLDNVNCWLATILSQQSEVGSAFRGVGFEQRDLQIGDFSLDINCTECTSPDFDKLLLSLYNFQNATELEDAIHGQAEGIFETDFFPALLDQIVDGAAKRCPHHAKYDPDLAPIAFLGNPADSRGLFTFMSSTANPSYFLAVNITIAVILFAVGFLAWLEVKRRNTKWVESLNSEGMALFVRQQEKERCSQAKLDTETMSLFACPVIPLRVRYGVPLAIAMNIGIYMGGHLGVLSIVNIDAAVAGEEFSINRFLEFKFIESTMDTYRNGGAEMAILLWIFTGIWPYVKLVGSLLLWVLPPSYLSVKRRGELLLWIDALAKLSVIDIFTMLLGFAVLLVFIGGPDEALTYSATSFYAFKVIIVPKAGLYCLIVAQRMSRVSSRFLLEYHDLLIAHAAKGDGRDEQLARRQDASFLNPSDDSSECESVGTRSDFVKQGAEETSESDSVEHGLSHEEGSSENSNKQQDRWGSIGVICGAFAIVVVFVIGCIHSPAISLDTSSLAGLAAESGMTYEELVNKYGVFLVMSSILVRASFVLDTKADYVGLGFLLLVGLVSVAYVFFMQAYQFIKRKLRLRRDGRKEPSYGHRGCGLPFYLRLYKWRYMEIYLISVAVGIWQLGSACSYGIYLYCDILRQIYSVMEVLGLVDESTAQCSRIQVSLPENLVIILGSFAVLLGTFLFQVSAQYKKNIADALRFVDDDDVPSLSLAWSSDRSKNSRYSHMTISISMDDFLDEIRSAPLTPSTATSTPPGTPLGPRNNKAALTLMPPPPMQPSLSQNPILETVSRAMPTSRTRQTTSVRFEEVDCGDGSRPPCPPSRVNSAHSRLYRPRHLEPRPPQDPGPGQHF